MYCKSYYLRRISRAINKEISAIKVKPIDWYKIDIRNGRLFSGDENKTIMEIWNYVSVVNLSTFCHKTNQYVLRVCTNNSRFSTVVLEN